MIIETGTCGLDIGSSEDEEVNVKVSINKAVRAYLKTE